MKNIWIVHYTNKNEIDAFKSRENARQALIDECEDYYYFSSKEEKDTFIAEAIKEFDEEYKLNGSQFGITDIGYAEEIPLFD